MAGVAVAGRRRRVRLSVAYLRRLTQASDHELWDILRNLVAARPGVTVGANATLGEVIDTFESQGYPLLLQHLFAAAHAAAARAEPATAADRIEDLQ